jgi:CRISPR-associated endonuclease Csn1
MRRKIGLDIGTNSIGWALVDEDLQHIRIAETTNSKPYGSIIFPEGVKIDQGNEISRAAERTAKRSARKLNFRRKLRKYETLKVLIEHRMCPLSMEELEKWRHFRDEVEGVKGPVQTFHHYPTNQEFVEWLRTDEKTDKNPYFLRYLFSSRKMDWENDLTIAQSLGRTFYHLSQRRGFKSNRLDQTDDDKIETIKEEITDLVAEADNAASICIALSDKLKEHEFDSKKSKDLDDTDKKTKRILERCLRIAENRDKKLASIDQIKGAITEFVNKKENLGLVKGDIRDLSEAVEEGGFKTLGQYFWSLYQKDRTTISNKIRKRYTGREEHYETEFHEICDVQQIPSELRQKLYKALFYQRPLRSQKGSVGKCTLEPRKPRCPISRPEFEEFRMLSLLNNIQVKEPGASDFRWLTLEERDRAVSRFFLQRASFKLSDLCKAINNHVTFYYAKDPNKTAVDWLINYPLNTTVTGSPISAALKSVIGDDWETKTFTYTTTNKNGVTKEHRVTYDDIWHALFTFDDRTKLEAYFIENIGLGKTEARKLSRVVPQQGYAQLSLKAINAILPWLRKGYLYSHAVFLARLPEMVKPELWSQESKQQEILDAVTQIIESHTDELSITHVVNSALKQFFAEKNYAHEYADSEFSEILSSFFEKRLGKKAWNNKSNKNELLLLALRLFQKVLFEHTGLQSFTPIPPPTIKERIVGYLYENELNNPSAKGKSLYHPSDIDGFSAIEGLDVYGNKIELLPSPMSDSIKNPVLMRTMHQLRKVLNHLLIQGEIDSNTRINIELAREVNDANKRAAIKKWQDRLRDERENARKAIEEYFRNEHNQTVSPTDDDILRYLLWEQQGRREIYELEPKNILLPEIIGENSRYDIEHTIPRSVSWDNSMANKTLCSKQYNREIKRNQIPATLQNYDDILDRLGGWETKLTELDRQINELKTTGISDKTKKDSIIQKRHLLRFERDFWKDKYSRFTQKEIKEGFKNSQLVDTGLITRYARNWLGSVFRNERGITNVSVVNGTAVSEFRRAWGLQSMEDKKSRSNHAHHCIDAITIACISKRHYDEFAKKWRQEEEDYDKHGVVQRLSIPKPWPTFTEDVKRIEQELLVVHQSEDKVMKHTRKKVRRRGKIERDKNTGDPLYSQGDTARGSLHQDYYYGSIMHPDTRKQIYVIRRQLDSITSSDVDKIIDPVIREIVKNGKKREKDLQDKVRSLKTQLRGIESEDEEASVKAEISRLEGEMAGLYFIPSKNGHGLGTPIRKVRIQAKLSKPLPDFKKQRDIRRLPDGSPKYPHKTEVYVANDSNYGLALYEDLEKDKRAAVSINLIEAVSSAKRSNSEASNLIEPVYNKMPLKGVLRIGTMVLFYENNPEEVWDLTGTELRKRLYIVKKTNKDGRVTFQFHQESRNDEQIKKDYELKTGEVAPAYLTNGISQVEFGESYNPRYLLSAGKMRMLIQEVDFDLTATGEIVRIG